MAQGRNKEPPLHGWKVELDRMVIKEEQRKDPACVDALMWIHNRARPERIRSSLVGWMLNYSGEILIAWSYWMIYFAEESDLY